METRKILIVAIIAIIILIVGMILIMWCRKSKATTSASKSDSSSSSDSQSRKMTQVAMPGVEGIKVETNNGEVKVSWNPMDGADHYAMYYSEKKGFLKEQANVHNPIHELSANMVSDVPMGYYFRVSAFRNVDGVSVETPLSDEYFMQLSASPSV